MGACCCRKITNNRVVSYCYHPKVDFPKTVRPEVLYFYYSASTDFTISMTTRTSLINDAFLIYIIISLRLYVKSLGINGYYRKEISWNKHININPRFTL